MTLFVTVMAAVFFGNLLTAGFIWAGFGITHSERQGGVPATGYYIILVFVSVIGLTGLWLANAPAKSATAAPVVDYRAYFNSP